MRDKEITKKSTRIEFDLADHLDAEEVEKFIENAGDSDLTEHFLDITIRKEEAA